MPHGTMGEDRFDEFLELHTEGLGRNAICRRMGLTASVVSRTADHLGVSFDRSRIQAATTARLADLAERRSILAEQLTSDAERLRAKLWEPTVVYAFGGAQNIYASEPVEEPPPADKRSLMGAAGMAIDKSLKLAPAEVSGGGADEAKSMLGKLVTGISAIVNEGTTQADGVDA
ncbi:hypothetical protein ACFYPN_16190 [Streptomyces sp. NPDC005576]|uniref:hypothetical protein n=1 Tax=Streptomyces sp. NPDC005576 TaxID=3364726 RepID=UPI0036A7CEE5